MPDVDLQKWIGRTQVDRDRAAKGQLERLAALLDRDPGDAVGEVVPQGWHCAFFPPLARQSELGADGHPKTGEFLPPLHFPRRMFAGRSMEFLAPIAAEAQIVRTSTIARITPKEGRRGPLVIVEVEHAIEADGQAALRETHNIFYMPLGPGGGPAGGIEAPAELPGADIVDTFEATPSLLFRYSAVGYNAHRIHYDLPYAQYEGHPGLVVNGGLLALKLLELAKKAVGGDLRKFEVRHRRPVYAGALVELRAVRDETVRLWALDAEGRVAAEGFAEAMR